jgi:hypothetical protein
MKMIFRKPLCFGTEDLRDEASLATVVKQTGLTYQIFFLEPSGFLKILWLQYWQRRDT